MMAQKSWPRRMFIHFGNSDARSLALDTLLAAMGKARGVSKRQRNGELRTKKDAH